MRIATAKTATCVQMVNAALAEAAAVGDCSVQALAYNQHVYCNARGNVKARVMRRKLTIFVELGDATSVVSCASSRRLLRWLHAFDTTSSS